MKIAQIAPIVERVPPKKYGGTERVVHALTEELVKRGHEVTLFASGDSQTTAKLEPVYPRGLREARMKDLYGVNFWTLLNIGLAYELQDEFDIIHDHMSPFSLPTSNLATTPVVATMHGAFNAENRKLFQTLRNANIVTISEAQIHSAPTINHAGTVYNGLYMDHYPFGNNPEDYLLYVGRITMEKGTHVAIEVAQQLDRKLIIAAKLDKDDQTYFREYVEPRLSDRVQWIGEVNEEERNELMSKAKCFLHPVLWREPFGLTLIEAMACGCPVVAYNQGSIPEIIKTGVTGYVVEDIEGMIDSVLAIDSISREECRRYALENFSAKRMADGYIEVYKKLLGEQ
ncbi:glycosyltransferase family 4 protein [Candidatus Parcubacteria bacterium]|nr:glycosyltransferase family 4 protein [Candidatus Parcubacteria bacterium]